MTKMNLRSPLSASLIAVMLLAAVACNTPGRSTTSRTEGVTGELAFLIAEGAQLRRLDSTGEAPILSLESGSFILDPAFSADGSQLVFSIQPPVSRDPGGAVDFGSDLYLGDPRGGALKLLVRHAGPGESVRSPSFMPDGKSVIFDVRGINEQGLSDFRVEVLNLVDGSRKRLIESAYEPRLSPDGASVASVALDSNTGHEDIMVFDLASSQSRRLLGSVSTKAGISSLAWSPDGRQIAFAASDPFVLGQTYRRGMGEALEHPTLRDVWLIERDGSNLRRLNDLAEPQPSLVWSRDGALLYVLGLSGLLSVDAKTGVSTRIGEGSYGGALTRIP